MKSDVSPSSFDDVLAASNAARARERFSKSPSVPWASASLAASSSRGPESLGRVQPLTIIGVDGTQACAYSVPPLSTIRQPTQAIAERAVQLLVTPAAGQPLVKEIFDFELIVRKSSKA